MPLADPRPDYMLRSDSIVARLLVPLLLLVAAIYWPGLTGGFVFDDYPNIVDNAALHVTWQSDWKHWLAATFSSPASQIQRPLAMLGFAINHALTGLDPYWMKLTNLAIHLVNTLLVYGLARCVLRMEESLSPVQRHLQLNWAAIWIAAAWALNPINLMSVLFVVQRMESLSHTFVFAGLWLYLAGRMQLISTGRGWLPLLGGLVGGAALGVLVKESAVLLPLYALALEWALLGFIGNGRNRDHRLLAVFSTVLVLPAAIGLAWLLPKALHTDAFARRSFSLGERLLTEGRVLVDYMRWTVLPDLDQLSLYHDDYPISHGLLSPPTTLWCLLLLTALLGTALWLRKRRPLMALGLAWFFCAQLLTATVIPLELVFEHRNYFASLGLCLVLADLLLRLPQGRIWRRVGAATAISLLLLYTGLTLLRAREWRDPLGFSLTEAAKHPQSPRAAYDVARNFVLLSEFRPDSLYLPRAYATLEHAIRVPDSSTLPETAAIILAARTGTPIREGWWLSLQHKLRNRPIGPQQYSSLGALVDCDHEHDCQLPKQKMVETFLAALERGPNAEVMNIYGNYALNGLQDPNLALRLWQDAAMKAPNVVQYQVTIAKFMIAGGQPDRAAVHIAKVRRLGRLGQNERIALNLEHLAAKVRREPPPTSPTKSPHDTR